MIGLDWGRSGIRGRRLSLVWCAWMSELAGDVFMCVRFQCAVQEEERGCLLSALTMPPPTPEWFMEAGR